MWKRITEEVYDSLVIGDRVKIYGLQPIYQECETYKIIGFGPSIATNKRCAILEGKGLSSGREFLGRTEGIRWTPVTTLVSPDEELYAEVEMKDQ